MMRRFFYIVLMLVPFMFTGVQSYAMPPHPDLLKKWQEEGALDKNIKRVAASKTINKSVATALKTTPSSGTVYIPVILVAYRNAYQADSPLPVMNNEPGGNTPLTVVLVLVLTGALLVSTRKNQLKRRLKPALPVYVAAMTSLLSCSVVTTSDYPERDFPTDSSVYTDLLNGQTESDLSVKKFYSDMSNSNLQLQFDVYGPVTVSKEWDYYGANDSDGDDLHPGELVAEAVRLVIKKYPGVDFSKYDNDNDTYDEIDTVIIIHEGPGEEGPSSPAETIWSHQWDLYSADYFGDGAGPAYVDGVWFNSYAMVPEYTTTRGDSSIGVLAHEFGHALGLPDLYDTSYATNGVGDWSLMSSGSWGSDGSGNDPAPLLAWERYKVGGTGTDKWVTITELSATQNDRQISDIESSHEVFKIMLDDTAGEEQYLLLEGKKAATTSGWYVPGTRVHGVNVVEADGGNNLWIPNNNGTASDLFCSEIKTSLTTSTTPNTKYYTGTSITSKTGDSGVSITSFSSRTSWPITFHAEY
ncbi:MAG: M6 family metalloprotease domain-containing protein [Spirochaetes bacterium]|nr:M6 family metalloprotease domain-containing protein [Spirochaetota bacterium]